MEVSELCLPERLDQPFAQQLHTDLLARRGQALAIDASHVERPGTLCLQVLLSAGATWKQDGHDFTIARPSPAFGDALSILGIILPQEPRE